MYLVKEESGPHRIGKYLFWSPSFSRAYRSQALKPSCIRTQQSFRFWSVLFIYVYISFRLLLVSCIGLMHERWINWRCSLLFGQKSLTISGWLGAPFWFQSSIFKTLAANRCCFFTETKQTNKQNHQPPTAEFRGLISFAL